MTSVTTSRNNLMPQPLTPPDLTRCQGEQRVGAFQLGGRIGELTRCSKVPTYIVRETQPAADGLMGSMSLCNDCKDAFLVQEVFRLDKVVFEIIPSDSQP